MAGIAFPYKKSALRYARYIYNYRNPEVHFTFLDADGEILYEETESSYSYLVPGAELPVCCPKYGMDQPAAEIRVELLPVDSYYLLTVSEFESELPVSSGYADPALYVRNAEIRYPEKGSIIRMPSVSVTIANEGEECSLRYFLMLYDSDGKLVFCQAVSHGPIPGGQDSVVGFTLTLSNIPEYETVRALVYRTH